MIVMIWIIKKKIEIWKYKNKNTNNSSIKARFFNSKQISEITLLSAISVSVNNIEKLKWLRIEGGKKGTWRVRGDRCRNEFVRRRLEGGRSREEGERIWRGVGGGNWEDFHGFWNGVPCSPGEVIVRTPWMAMASTS